MSNPERRPMDLVPSDPYERRDWLAAIVPTALGYSADLAPAVAAYVKVTRVAVDVTYDDATDADLLKAAKKALKDMRHMADCAPLRNKLKALIVSLRVSQRMKAMAKEGKQSRKARKARD